MANMAWSHSLTETCVCPFAADLRTLAKLIPAQSRLVIDSTGKALPAATAAAVASAAAVMDSAPALEVVAVPTARCASTPCTPYTSCNLFCASPLSVRSLIAHLHLFYLDF